MQCFDSSITCQNTQGQITMILVLLRSKENWSLEFLSHFCWKFSRPHSPENSLFLWKQCGLLQRLRAFRSSPPSLQISRAPPTCSDAWAPRAAGASCHIARRQVRGRRGRGLGGRAREWRIPLTQDF